MSESTIMSESSSCEGSLSYTDGVHCNESESPEHPSQILDELYVHAVSKQKKPSFGKWMIFRYLDEIDETWALVKAAVEQDELHGCTHAKCSTMMYNPSKSGPGPDTVAVICVYTEEHDIDAIGLKVIEIAQHDIKYKRNEETCKGWYSFTGRKEVSYKTLYWNSGRPSFECEGQTCYKSFNTREDIVHRNVVEAPNVLGLGVVDGKWVLSLEYRELTGLWHKLKGYVESESKNFGILRMICPPKLDRKSSSEKPKFHLYTSKERQTEVGRTVIRMVKRDIVYKPDPSCRSRFLWSRDEEKVLFWNDGEPDFERVYRKGITKNWRTGEDV